MQIRFRILVAGVHPVDEQATIISTWLDPTLPHQCTRRWRRLCPSLTTSICQYRRGCSGRDGSADWAGNMTYTPIDATTQANYLRYCASGRPMLIHHGAIGCYSDLA
jgi:hypothetical protein